MDQTQQAKSSFSFGRFLAFLKLLIVSNLFKVVLSSILSFIVTTGVLSLVVYATREFEGNKLVVLANVFYVGAALGVLFLIAIVCIRCLSTSSNCSVSLDSESFNLLIWQKSLTAPS